MSLFSIQPFVIRKIAIFVPSENGENSLNVCKNKKNSNREICCWFRLLHCGIFLINLNKNSRDERQNVCCEIYEYFSVALFNVFGFDVDWEIVDLVNFELHCINGSAKI